MTVKIRVLIAEDEKPLANALQYKLKGADFDVEVAHDGEEALEKMKQFNPDIVLLDLVMPKLDGFGVLEQLQKENNTTPVVVLSNLGQDSDIKNTKKLGAKDFLIKSDTQLEDIVKKIKITIAK